ncbi:hypothetical protein [Fusobacterium necrophorum]|uniref:P-type conjugative transfer protein TrbJ n=1 Tax=Fusobacterium necrophorum subsp. funduliforme TaxID=143387 RepID=A0A161QV41_9FUSO|nr:hypothetical protein [Fusobacterium necrophorum]KYL04712.1 hypothetical protein A2J07_05245 [Fusobacterium necrophorum subsp. funduliforme]KYM54842.1 hypothetical protein A2U07_03365 [Fusobacterium necrophorum subsp. funduliforme]MCF0162262.1 hypothetical protein [Fusobacterium necrophorum]MDK4473542.1 hypothetical protein [Fusobacterium necrophorum]MDK4484957.1 hypothetical protein [Fusobacterium necrophorum]
MKLKRIVVYFLIGILSFNLNAGIFGGKSGGSLKEILKLLKSIDSATGKNGTATLAEIESKLELIRQTEMQLEQLKMEAENFRKLGKELAHADIAKINQILDRTLGFKDYVNTTATTMGKNLDSFFSEYNGSHYQIFDKYDLDVLKEQRKKLREHQTEMQKSVYNNMAKNEMYANINDQGQELKRKINTLNNVAGTLQAIQAIGGILEQTNMILLETKQMIATNMEMKDRIEAQVRKEAEIQNDNAEAEAKETEEILKKVREEEKRDKKKANFKIKF